MRSRARRSPLFPYTTLFRSDSALAHAVTLHSDAVFIVDWLRGQAEYHFSAAPLAVDCGIQGGCQCGAGRLRGDSQQHTDIAAPIGGDQIGSAVSVELP